MAVRKNKVDQYGFEHPDGFDYASYEEFESSYLPLLTRRAIKWKALVGNKEKISKGFRVKRYVRKGIPSEYRSMVWMRVSGAHKQMKHNPTGLYEKLLEEEGNPEVMESIKLDLHRTFPENIYFCDTEDSRGLRKPLFNVLKAFAVKNQEHGYCQGLNFIAGVLLLVVHDEEKSFWLLDTLVNKILPDFYSPKMVGLKTEQEVLAQLVRAKVPVVSEIIDKHGVPWAIICTKWFICLYIDILPIETVLRIWDSLFYEGAKILHRVAVTLIKENQEKFVACSRFDEVLKTFQDITTDSKNFRCHEIMQHIFTEPGSFPKAKIKQLRKKSKQKLQEEEESRQQNGK